MTEIQIILLGIGQGLFFSVILWLRRKSNPANLFLFFLILCLTSLLWSGYLDDTGTLQTHPHFINVFEPLILVVAPLFYLYVKHTIFSYHLYSPFLHAIPCCLVYLSLIPFYFATVTEKLDFIQTFPESTYLAFLTFLLEMFVRVFFVFQFILYWGKAFNLLWTHQHSIKQKFSNIEGIDLNWLMTLSIALIISFLAFLVDELIMVGQDLCHDGVTCVLNSDWQGWHFASLSIAVCFYVMSILALRQNGINQTSETITQPSEDVGDINASTTEEKYAKSSLDIDRAKALFLKTKDTIGCEQSYINPDLSLDELAKQIQVSRHDLSQAINQIGNINFFDLINGFRIEHAQSLLKQDSNKSILEICYESGFNSRSAFNKAFKHHTGMTPSSYRS